MEMNIPFSKGTNEISILSRMANRHGLIAGATGTGKTVTLRVLAEGFSRLGVPVFMADVKGDLAGLAYSGSLTESVEKRIKDLEIKGWEAAAHPVIFWDVFGELGHPVRTTVSEMGPLLFSRLLGLNDVQSGLLQLVFKVADDHGLLLLDLKDLRAVVQHVGENAKTYTNEYGNVSSSSIGAIQRALLALEEQGGDKLFGEPALSLEELMRTTSDGKGVINVLASDKLLHAPQVYSTLLLWLLSELFERLPEVGDPEKPKLVFFFDEAHLLFEDAPPVLLQKIEQVIRLVRSKGVGVYFVTQQPTDLPDDVLAQLGNRVQHAIRAFTAKDRKSIAKVAETFATNPKVDVEEVITKLAIGEALVSVLDGSGTPTPVERALIYPPHSRLGPITQFERLEIIKDSPVKGKYDAIQDRESAYEKLKQRALQKDDESEDKAQPKGRQRESAVEALIKSVARSVGSQLGRQIMRGILGSVLGGSRR